MEKQDYINRINQAIQNRTPYSMLLAEMISNLDQTQTTYFFDVVAPYYMDGPGKSPYGTEFKDMEYMARAVAHNKDVSSILGIDYRQIGSKIAHLPDIGQTQAVEQNHMQQQTQHNRSREQQIHDMYQLVDKYVMQQTESPEKRKGISNQSFCQSGNVEKNKIPIQGWKFHISANNLDDYERLLKVALPEFQRAGIAFKVVRPDVFEQQMQSAQAGKAITVYPTPDFDIKRFSPELKSVLFEDGICPNGDARIKGRICARYGEFRKAPGLISQNGEIYPDTRWSAVKPDFVSENTPEEILNFYTDSARRYQETGDAKTYLQEMATLTAGNGRDNPWVTIVIDKGQEHLANIIFHKEDIKSGSFTFKLNDEEYRLVNAKEASNILAKLNKFGIGYERPEWDERYNVYAFENPEIAKQIENAMQLDENVAGAPYAECVYIPGYGTGIMVDTTRNKEFIDICIENQIAIADIGVNVQKQEIGNILTSLSQNSKEIESFEEFSFK